MIIGSSHMVCIIQHLHVEATGTNSLFEKSNDIVDMALP